MDPKERREARLGLDAHDPIAKHPDIGEEGARELIALLLVGDAPGVLDVTENRGEGVAAAFRQVVLALDADPTGDAAATVLAARLCPFAARLERWLPVRAKDGNKILQRDRRTILQTLVQDAGRVDPRESRR